MPWRIPWPDIFGGSMSLHVELNPDDDMLGLCLGLKAMRLASTQKTHKTGTIRIPTSTGKDFIAGEGAEDGANWIDEEGVQTPLVDTDAIDKAVDEIGRKADAAAASADKAYEEAKKTGQLAVTASRTEYATSTDATATPSDGWSETPPTYMDGQYTWLRVTVTYGDGHTELSNPVLMTGPKGGKGETGTAGVSVTSLTTFWRLAADTPDTPSGADDPSGWSRTEPSIPDGYESKLYRTIRTIMSDGTATWTSPDVDSMFEYMARTYRTASGAVTVSSEAKRTAEGNAETIKQVGTTANDALSKATTVETNFAGFKTEVSETYQTKAGMSSYGTKSYIDETSKSVALGVVQDYKGADGSGLATKSDISVSRTEITSEVSSKYATKDGVSEEISSKITQNNSSWELKFASKTEAKSAQDAANAANAAAADAQSRVGNLEPCIRMTSDGVRVGKRSGDSFTGTSALVGTGGTFDILDEHGERMLEMSDTGLRLPVLKNNTAFKIGRYHHPTYDSDVVYIGDDYDSNVASPARIEFNRNSINLTARLLNMNLTDSRFYVNGHPMGKASDIKQSQRWSNINMQAWNFGNLGIINILHPSGTNAHIMDNDNPTEIGRISPLNAPRDYVGCTLAAYGNTTLFAEVTPAGLVKCFTAFGGQHDWDYFTGTIVFPLTW
nr:MAG TPA: tail protein [Caudoviricetes sp.]